MEVPSLRLLIAGLQGRRIGAFLDRDSRLTQIVSLEAAFCHS
jgi:hypothetical protein